MDDAGGHRHHDGRPIETAPFGSWRSAIDIELVASSAIALAEPWLDGDDAYWLESRPAERGRRTLLRHTTDGATHELTPAPFAVGNRVHEYGGGSYAVDGGRVVASSTEDGRLWRLDPDGLAEPVALTPPDGGRFADMRFDTARDRLYAVRETHDADEPDRPDLVVNELVSIALDGSDGAGRVIVSGPDFVAAPRPSPDGSHLAWLEWDLPGMPWDSTRLRVAEVLADGSLGAARTVAGGPGISIVQPAWRADGVLHYVSDETGWWNLFALDGPDRLDGPARNLAPMEAELGDPAWVFGALVVRVHGRRRGPGGPARRRARRPPADHAGRRGRGRRRVGCRVLGGRRPPGRGRRGRPHRIRPARRGRRRPPGPAFGRG